MESKKTQLVHIQWLRVIAAFAVVMMHTAAQGWYEISHTTAPWRALTAWDALVRWPVPVFVMITGALFLPRKTSMKTILTRYIPRMLLCFVIWSGLFALYRYRQGASLSEAAHLFVEGQYHLWYLPFLCGVYLTLPFLQKIVQDERLTNLLVPVSFVVCSLIPWTADVAALVLPRWAGVIGSIRNHLNYSFFMDLLVALVLGHWLEQRELSAPRRKVLYALGILSVVLTEVGTFGLTALTDSPVSVFFSHSAPTSLWAAAALYVFAKYNLTRLPKLVDGLAKVSFGVYLSHAMLILFLQDRGIYALTWNPVWSVPVLAAAVFSLCAAGSALVRRIGMVGKYLV